MWADLSKVFRGHKAASSETPGEKMPAGGKHDNKKQIQEQEQAALNAFDKVDASGRTQA